MFVRSVWSSCLCGHCLQCVEGDASPRLSFRKRLVNSILGLNPMLSPLSPSSPTEYRDVSTTSSITRAKSRSVRLPPSASAQRNRHPRPLSWGCVCTIEFSAGWLPLCLLTCLILHLYLLHLRCSRVKYCLKTKLNIIKITLWSNDFHAQIPFWRCGHFSIFFWLWTNFSSIIFSMKLNGHYCRCSDSGPVGAGLTFSGPFLFWQMG